MTKKTNAIFTPPAHRSLIVLGIMAIAIMELLDTTIVNVSLPDMMGSLGASTRQITWVLTAYIVASAICIPLTGFLEKRFGRRRLLLTNTVGFMLFSMLCGMSTTLPMIVFFRLCQGACGAVFVPLSQTILRDIFPPSEQPKAMAIWGVGLMVAPVFGPVIGGYITSYASWRWIFYVNLPGCILSFILLAWLIKDTKKNKRTNRLPWYTPDDHWRWRTTTLSRSRAITQLVSIQ